MKVSHEDIRKCLSALGRKGHFEVCFCVKLAKNDSFRRKVSHANSSVRHVYNLVRNWHFFCSDFKRLLRFTPKLKVFPFWNCLTAF